ncbi:DUF3307 domain-containing protein [Desemzia sp. FAM 24101]|uniref:DUF3307 domain-containing protein n=1 Tax=unclassified Desemzia TaxID=2685243 RepID=UPI00388930B8
MNQEVLLTLFIGHVLGDFYFQSSTLARDKEYSGKKLWLHCLGYLITMVGVTLPFFGWSLVKIALWVSTLHFLIDGSKFLAHRKYPIEKGKDTFVYLIDQGLHILVLLTVGVYLSLSSITILPFSVVESVIAELGWTLESLLSWVLILLVLMQPCSITIKKVLNYYRPTSEEHVDEGIPNAGALIGVFERVFILLMLYANQFTAIGFVLTAKSIARYNKISENPQFAEYYLLGTLLSTLLIIISYFFIF